MWYSVMTSLPPLYVWAIVLLFTALIAHHAVHGRKWWSLITGLVLSFLVGWVAETLGLGWYAVEFFGSRWIALGVYTTVGLLWLGVESICDLRRVIPRFESYAEDWCKKHGAGEWSGMSPAERANVLRARLLSELDNRNANNPGDPIIYPRRYYRSRDRRWWFVNWFLFWPAFLLNAILNTVVIDPWKWLSHLLPGYVWLVQGLVIPATIPHVELPRRRMANDIHDSDL